ncbi:glycine zipper 2TM domain-containing protein [Pokkaliibacter sp. CJK22405]|uniref:glycine zipper 2TM domain-containing protein n=1 Tax=Pokkaliibacter sp. CJK22405 TaxID=3384615 RepID=UPI003985445D
MNKSLIVGIVVGAIGVTAGGAIGGYQYFSQPEQPTVAQITNVEKLTQTQNNPREVCENKVVTHQKPVQDQHRITGTVVGALAGGLLGNQVGGGNGKKLATIAGAAAGGYAGNQVQQNMQNSDTYTTNERECHTVQDSKTVVTGYKVTYKLGDGTGHVTMDHKPQGDTIPVRNGELVLNEG